MFDGKKVPRLSSFLALSLGGCGELVAWAWCGSMGMGMAHHTYGVGMAHHTYGVGMAEDSSVPWHDRQFLGRSCGSIARLFEVITRAPIGLD